MPEFTRGKCRSCNATCEQRRLNVSDPSGALLPAVQCIECEAVCLVTPVATPAQSAESARNRVLLEKLAESDRAREDLAGQLLLTERRAASSRPPPDTRPCVHCGDDRLSRQHLIAAGHSFEAA